VATQRCAQLGATKPAMGCIAEHTPERAGVASDVSLCGERSDAAPVEAIVLRSEETHAQPFRRHQRSVVSASTIVFGNSSQRDDVRPEVFAAFWQSTETLDPNRGTSEIPLSASDVFGGRYVSLDPSVHSQLLR
jgi:hypothetical protein